MVMIRWVLSGSPRFSCIIHNYTRFYRKVVYQSETNDQQTWHCLNQFLIHTSSTKKSTQHHAHNTILQLELSKAHNYYHVTTSVWAIWLVHSHILPYCMSVIAQLFLAHNCERYTLYFKKIIKAYHVCCLGCNIVQNII